MEGYNIDCGTFPCQRQTWKIWGLMHVLFLKAPAGSRVCGGADKQRKRIYSRFQMEADALKHSALLEGVSKKKTITEEHRMKWIMILG